MDITDPVCVASIPNDRYHQDYICRIEWALGVTFPDEWSCSINDSGRGDQYLILVSRKHEKLAEALIDWTSKRRRVSTEEVNKFVDKWKEKMDDTT